MSCYDAIISKVLASVDFIAMVGDEESQSSIAEEDALTGI
jgi:hypothetical protein